jgi:hypothetical protein
VSLEGGSSCERYVTAEPRRIELPGPESLLAAVG